MAVATIEKGVIKLLEGIASGDVFAGIAPEKQRSPFVTYQRVSGFKVRAINGPSGLARRTFQIDTYSDDYPEVLTISDDIRKTLDGFSGTVAIGADSVVIGGCSMVGEREFVEEDSDPKLYRVSVDYQFNYEEEI